MPNLDGLQSTRLIRQMGFSAPIVALSAFAEESNIKDCMESGMNMFLRYTPSKGLHMNEISNMCRQQTNPETGSEASAAEVCHYCGGAGESRKCGEYREHE